jgi:hypothetical protein
MSATSLAEERRLYVPKLVVASPWAENLARHWLNHKSDVKIPGDQDSTTGENENRLHKIYSCPRCPKLFIRPVLYQRHKTRHENRTWYGQVGGVVESR